MINSLLYAVCSRPGWNAGTGKIGSGAMHDKAGEGLPTEYDSADELLIQRGSTIPSPRRLDVDRSPEL